MRFVKRVAMAVASGYVLMFFSEFYFLNEAPGAEFIARWNSNPLSIPGWLGGFALYYAAWAWIMLACIGICRVRSFWSLGWSRRRGKGSTRCFQL